MGKNNKTAEQIIRSCELCNQSYWQKDLIGAKKSEITYDIKGEKGKDKVVDILICHTCKDCLDKGIGVGVDAPLPEMRLL